MSKLKTSLEYRREELVAVKWAIPIAGFILAMFVAIGLGR